MQSLTSSLFELITQTSTNLPPDVRRAMGDALAAETPATQSQQALNIIATNIDMAHDRRGGDLPGHRHADVRRPCARGREPDRLRGGDSRSRGRGHASAASCGRIRWIR